NGILVDERTYRSSRNAIEFEEAEPITAKGKAEPVSVWVAVAVQHAPSRRGAESTFVGRAEELARVLAAWDRVTGTGTPALAIIVGEPGLGKTRLLREVTARIDGADVCTGG